MWWWWLVPLSSAQGWLDAYFVNIRTCEVKRNIQKGTNKPKRKKNNLWTWSCNQRRVGDFSFPSHRLFLLLLLLVVVIISVCGFHLLSFSHRRIGFSPLIGTIKMRTPRQKRQKETVERKWPDNVDRKQNSQHETFSRRWPAAVIESSIVSCFLNEYIATRNAQLSLLSWDFFFWCLAAIHFPSILWRYPLIVRRKRRVRFLSYYGKQDMWSHNDNNLFSFFFIGKQKSREGQITFESIEDGNDSRKHVSAFIYVVVVDSFYLNFPTCFLASQLNRFDWRNKTPKKITCFLICAAMRHLYLSFGTLYTRQRQSAKMERKSRHLRDVISFGQRRSSPLASVVYYRQQYNSVD
jgi:hypothetical protein